MKNRSIASRRMRQHDMQNGAPMSFGNLWCARTTFPLKEVLNPELCPDFFSTVVTMLHPMDQVSVGRFRNDDYDGHDAEIVEFAIIRILKTDRRVHWVFEKPVKVFDDASDEAEISVKRRGTLWYVKQHGTAVEGGKFNTEIEANEFADRLRREEMKKAA